MRPAVILLALARPAGATDYEIFPPDDLWGTLQILASGDTVTVHAGVYVRPGFFEVTWPGTAAQPIVVAAAAGERPVLSGDASQNMINVSGSYFVFAGFEIDGGSHGIRLANSEHGVIEDMVIHDTADVGLSMNRPGHDYAFMVVRGCEIFGTAGTGECFYLGCNDSACRVHDSIIERNFCHDTGGSQGDGIELKKGSYSNVIRDNVVVRTNYPGILVYGADGLGQNLVEGNFVHTVADNGIQVAAEAMVRNNIVMFAGGSALASQPHQGVDPHDLTIVHNTLYNPGDTCFRGSAWDLGAGLVLANNALYCDGGTAILFATGSGSAAVSANVVVGAAPAAGTIAGRSSAQDLLDLSAWNLYPTADSPLRDSGAPAHAVVRDYNGTLRDVTPDPGAYEWVGAANPGWVPVEDFREGSTGGSDGAAALDGGLDAVSPDGGVDVDLSADAGPEASVPATDGASPPDTALDTVADDVTDGSGCACHCARPSPTLPWTLLLLAAVLVSRARRARCRTLDHRDGGGAVDGGGEDGCGEG